MVPIVFHAEITRFDKTLTRLFEWKHVAGHKSIVRLFAKFDMARNENVQAQIYRWIFDHIRFDRITLDMDSTVITRYGTPEGGAKGYNAAKPGRLSHHPLLAFVAECRMVTNFWLRPSNSSSANNTLQFLESTLPHLESKIVGLLRADSGFYDDAILTFLQGRHIDYIISAKLTHGLQRAIAERVTWWSVERGLEIGELNQAQGWSAPRRIIVVRQYAVMSLFRQAVLRGSVQHTLATLHHKVFAVGAFWHKNSDKRQLNLAVSRQRRAWFEGLWTNAGNAWHDDNTVPQNL
ncbi:transposase [Candidatus Nitrotoga sp. AM1P]|uniref:transposase n=1 Tax=Candidatus Nitrotoga sp. AM1P TaxID=2559597 RepID=UPI0010B6CE17|nr:transposase [Candidatus Nitrotoga sp. AM1P]BBJ23370.1 hypothetical protein W01_12970 [Candidatus Nitrotoga sp. AM1P]